MKVWLIFLLPALLLAGCAQHPKKIDTLVNRSKLNELDLSHILILPTNIFVLEHFPAGTTEEIPIWTKSANKIFDQRLSPVLAESNIQSLALEQTSQPLLVMQYIPLIQRIISTVQYHSSPGWNFWPHKMADFDYSMGKGLKSLQKDNIDAILYITGSQQVGKLQPNKNKQDIHLLPKEELTIHNLLLGTTLTDPKSGSVVWVNITTHKNVDLRNANDIDRVIKNISDNISKTSNSK